MHKQLVGYFLYDMRPLKAIAKDSLEIPLNHVNNEYKGGAVGGV